MLALDLLKRMSDVYAVAATYADTGNVTRVLTTHRGRDVETARFETSFERLRSFRFDYRRDTGGG